MRALAQGTALVLALSANVARATPGNDDAFFMSDEAAVSGGAVLATTQDSGAVWYNPAGLGGNTRNRIDLSSTAFQLRLERAPEFVRMATTDFLQFSELSTSEIQVVPTALVGMRRFGDFSAAFGVFVPLQDENDFSNPGGITTDDIELVTESRSQSAAQRYQLTVAAGWQPHPRFRIGFSVQGVYETKRDSGRVIATVLTQDNGDPTRDVGQIGILAESSVEEFRLALEATLGIQWEILANLHLGLVLRSPRLAVYRDDNLEELVVIGFRDDLSDDSSFDGLYLDRQRAEEISFRQVYTSPRIYLGLAWRDHWGFVSLEADVQTGMPDGVAFNEVRPQFNVRAGFSYRVARKVAIGAGLFTDRSAYGLGVYPTQDVDFYGGTVGVRFDTPVSVEREEDDESPHDDLRFTTTLAFRDAYGTGTIQGLNLELFEEGPRREERETGITAHEMSLHLGSGLQY